MKIGIIGLPNVGKTTVFNALTRNTVFTGSYASPSGEHHIGQVNVPDPRFDRLVRMYEPKKAVPANIEFVDVAGITKGASRGEGLSDKMLQFIRDVDALIHVVRVFEDETVPHIEEKIDPIRDLLTVETEMILHDLLAVEKRLERLDKELTRLPKDKRLTLSHEKDILERFREHLVAEKTLRSLKVPPDDLKIVRGFSFLSFQPMMILLNIGEEQIDSNEEMITRCGTESGMPVMAICGKIEAEISQLEDEDAAMFMSDLGIAEPAQARVIRSVYQILDLQTFFTVVHGEVRAWAIRRGADAVTAAGKIHSDMARGFIRAEVVAYDDLIAAGSWTKAKETGRFKLEGKGYIVQDGDILSIRFNI